MKRFTLLFVVLAAIILITSSCNKENTKQPDKKQIDLQLIGTWRHQEVPSLPHYNSWLITINEDGTYRTESDEYEAADSGMHSHTETFGTEGIYVVAENIIMFKRNDTGKSRTEIYEISELNGKKQLIFKDSSGKNKSSVSIDGVIYDMMFIKEN